MTSRKLIQNFSDGRAYLVADPEAPRDILGRTLTRLGMALLAIGEEGPERLDGDRDVVFLDGDQPHGPEWLFAPGASVPRATVIGLVGVEAPGRLRMLADAGATSFLRKPVAAAAIYSALFFGVNLHRRIRATDERLAAQERRRHQRRFVTRAVIELVRTHGLSDDEAYAALRRDSMRLRLNVEDYCERAFGPAADGPDPPFVSEPGFTMAEQEKTEREKFLDAGSGSPDVDDGADGPRRHADQARRA